MPLKTAVAATTGSMAAASSATRPIIAILMTMKMQPETRVVANVATAAATGEMVPRRDVAVTIAAMSIAAIPSAAKSINGELVVIWITAAEIRPMTSAWPRLGRTARIVRQKAEMMNSGLMTPPEMLEIALPTVKLRIKPAAKRTARRTRARTSRVPWSVVETVRGWAAALDMVIDLS